MGCRWGIRFNRWCARHPGRCRVCPAFSGASALADVKIFLSDEEIEKRNQAGRYSILHTTNASTFIEPDAATSAQEQEVRSTNKPLTRANEIEARMKEYKRKYPNRDFGRTMRR